MTQPLWAVRWPEAGSTRSGKMADLRSSIQLTLNWRIPSGMWVKFHSIARREDGIGEAPKDILLLWFLSSPLPLPPPSPLPKPTTASRHSLPPKVHLLSDQAPPDPSLANTSLTCILSLLRSCWGSPVNLQQKILCP